MASLSTNRTCQRCLKVDGWLNVEVLKCLDCREFRTLYRASRLGLPSGVHFRKLRQIFFVRQIMPRIFMTNFPANLKRRDVEPVLIRRLNSCASQFKVISYIQLIVLMLATSILLVSVGCRAFREPDAANCPPDGGIPNPLSVPMMDRWYVMDQISDEIDDHFRIYREERIRVVDSVMSEGWIETHPKIGGTLLEPWKTDSTPGFEKLHASLQTVRRFAKVRVLPTGNSYLVDVKVFKELEDLEQPIGSVVTTAPLRHDSTLDIDRELDAETNRKSGWIPMGRDFSLEQLILANIQQRLTKSVE